MPPERREQLERPSACGPLSVALELQALTSRYSSLREFNFPPKKWFNSFGTSTVEKRRSNFQTYLQELVRWVVCVVVARRSCSRLRLCACLAWCVVAPPSQLSLQPRPLELNLFLEVTNHLYGTGVCKGQVVQWGVCIGGGTPLARRRC